MNQFRLLATRRFAPFFATQALAAFNDNAFRKATIVLVAFQLGLSDDKVSFYTNLAPALFILPFFLFSASAGQIGGEVRKAAAHPLREAVRDRGDVRGRVGLPHRHPALLLTVLFLMGLHSTVFGPIKYAILPQVLQPAELVGGNGMVEMGTSMAILIGMIAGGAAMTAGRRGAVAVGGAGDRRGAWSASARAARSRAAPRPRRS